jgi:hypothetical protein
MGQHTLTADSLSIELTHEDLLNQSIPRDVVNPNGFPGVFG